MLAWLFCADTVEAVRRCVEFETNNITGNDPEVALTTLRRMGLHRCAYAGRTTCFDGGSRNPAPRNMLFLLAAQYMAAACRRRRTL